MCSINWLGHVFLSLPSSPAIGLEGAAGRLMRPRRGHAEALCEFVSALHGARTRLKKRLVAQQLHVRQAPLAQKPHVLRPHSVHSLAAVLACGHHWLCLDHGLATFLCTFIHHHMFHRSARDVDPSKCSCRLVTRFITDIFITDTV
jgi:hypothetical protein